MSTKRKKQKKPKTTIKYRNYFIESYDKYNWLLKQNIKGVDKEGNKTQRTEFHGYYPTVESALKEIIDLRLKEHKKLFQLAEYYDKLKELKEDLVNELKR